MKGFNGKMLLVDLGERTIKPEELRNDLVSNYVGGSGIGARLLFELLGNKISAIEPLDPENLLIFMTGPFNSTTLPSSARMTVNALSPLTGLFGESNVGGYLGYQLQAAGWDGIILKGAASEPLYLCINDNNVKLINANDLWGKGTYESTDILQEKHKIGSRKPSVAVIGPAGENKILYASIAHNKCHHFGRTGMGAVMGSKNLKALVVNGSGKLEPGNPEAYKTVRQRISEKMKSAMIPQVLNLYGTNAGLDMGHMAGDVPIKNWQLGVWYEGIAGLNGPAFDPILIDRGTCYACPVACKRVVEVKEGAFKMERGPGPEYETVASFGTMCMIPDASAISKINERCNDLGLDTISCGCTISFAIDCFEKGHLTKEQTNGLDLKWNDPQLVIKLVEMTAHKEGFGAELALGSDRLSAKFDNDTGSLLSTVKKMEAPMHDPRAYHGLGLAYATANRGACHVSGVSQYIEQGVMVVNQIGLEGAYTGQSSELKAKMVALTQDYGSIFGTAAVMCLLGGMVYDELDFKDCLSAVTGREWTLDEIMIAGCRNWELKRAINLLRGARSLDDLLPKLLMTPTTEGGAAGSVPDLKLMLKEYYQLRGYDQDGFPSKEKMAELGLQDVFEALKACC